jgi:hypothetical protein
MLFFSFVCFNPYKEMIRLLTALFFVLAVSTGSAFGTDSASEANLADAIRGYEAAANVRFQGLPDDWSFHHLIVSRGQMTPAGSGQRNDPRYWLALIRQAARQRYPHAQQSLPVRADSGKNSSTAERDWSKFIGASGTVGPLQYPAKFSLAVNSQPSCSDFIVFNTSLSGTFSRASVIAFNNIYQAPTCSGTIPNTLWAYNTGGTAITSVILSPDGSQIAFVQTTRLKASLVVLKWSSTNGGTATAPVTIPNNRNYPSCTAPCMIAVPFANGATDFSSSPFYDYSGSDSLYVGDSVGVLHKFQPVFNGTPAEVTNGGFPLTVSHNARPLSDPVYDSGLDLIVVGDGHQSGSINDGELHLIDGSTGTVQDSASICHGIGYLSAPVLDATAGKLYAVCAADVGGNGCPANGSNACLRQFDETAISGASGVGEPLGASAYNTALGPGTVDNIYLNAADPANPTGDFYICGNPGGLPTLYRVPINSNLISTPVAINTLSTINATACSPVTEFFNSSTATDWLFLSVRDGGSQNGCSGTGCVYGFNATTPLAVGAVAGGGILASGGSSGIVVDNVGAGNSTVANIYYSTLATQSCADGTGGCAIQVSQNGLR